MTGFIQYDWLIHSITSYSIPQQTGYLPGRNNSAHWLALQWLYHYQSGENNAEISVEDDAL